MTSLELQLTVGAAPVGVLACWVWAFLSRPRSSVVRSERREACPEHRRQKADMGLSWGTVEAVRVFLAETPSHELNHEFAEALGGAVDRHRELTEASGRMTA